MVLAGEGGGGLAVGRAESPPPPSSSSSAARRLVVAVRPTDRRRGSTYRRGERIDGQRMRRPITVGRTFGRGRGDGEPMLIGFPARVRRRVASESVRRRGECVSALRRAVRRVAALILWRPGCVGSPTLLGSAALYFQLRRPFPSLIVRSY